MEREHPALWDECSYVIHLSVVFRGKNNNNKNCQLVSCKRGLRLIKNIRTFVRTVLSKKRVFLSFNPLCVVIQTQPLAPIAFKAWRLYDMPLAESACISHAGGIQRGESRSLMCSEARLMESITHFAVRKVMECDWVLVRECLRSCTACTNRKWISVWGGK